MNLLIMVTSGSDRNNEYISRIRNFFWRSFALSYIYRTLPDQPSVVFDMHIQVYYWWLHVRVHKERS